MHYSFRNRVFDFSKKPAVMGIINVTPDSFFAGSRRIDTGAVVRLAKQMAADGADILDIGGESTRPGAAPVSPDEEVERVVGAIKAVAADVDLPISIDTRHAAVAHAAVEAGAEIVNDISAFTDPQMIKVVAETGSVAVLMHMQGTPETMQQNPEYQDVISEITTFFKKKIAEAVAGGVSRERLWIDPGIGFGKRVVDNLAIIRELARFNSFGVPILMGLSRKSFIGHVTGAPVEERLLETLLYDHVALQNGASILRVHDVAEAVRGVKVYQSLLVDGFSA